MVAIRSNQADSFIRRPPDHILFWLVFGADPGLVSERTSAIVKACGVNPADPFQMVRLHGDAIANDPLSLLDEAHAIPLFGGARVISIEVGGRNFSAALEGLVASPPRDCKIVLSAGALKRDSALRKLLEREKIAAAIECNNDGPEEIDLLIRSTLRNSGVRIDDDALAALSQMVGGDRLASRSELEKLMLFAHGQQSITLSDVEAAISDASGLAIDTAISAAFLGNMVLADETAYRIFATGGDANYLLVSALRQATGLHRAKLAQGAGGEAPRLFGLLGGARNAELALRNWRAADLERASTWISEAIGAVRRAPALAEPMAIRILWRIARAAGPATQPTS